MTLPDPPIFRWEFNRGPLSTWTYRTIGGGEPSPDSRPYPTLNEAMAHARTLGFDEIRHEWSVLNGNRVTDCIPGQPSTNKPASDHVRNPEHPDSSDVDAPPFRRDGRM